VSGEEPEHTVVSRETAQSCGVWVNDRRSVIGTIRPTGKAIGPVTECEMFLLADDLPGRTKRITVRMVDSLEEYCGLPPGAAGRSEIQLGKHHIELLRQLREEQPLRTGARLSEHWGETIWRLAAYTESGEHVWINIIRSYQQEESEITLATSHKLGNSKPGEGCLVPVHMRAGRCPITEGPIRAWTVEAIGRLELGDSPDGKGQNPIMEGADMVIGVWDWGRVKEHVRHRWRRAEVLAPTESESPSKWHLRVRKANGEVAHLDVYKGAGMTESVITHEAAAIAGFLSAAPTSSR
jgi:hypothetical protein